MFRYYEDNQFSIFLVRKLCFAIMEIIKYCFSTQRLDEEEEFRKKNLKVVEVRYYGDTKRNIAIKYKHGTAIAKQMMENKDIKPLVFMITLPDGSYVILYPFQKFFQTNVC